MTAIMDGPHWILTKNMSLYLLNLSICFQPTPLLPINGANKLSVVIFIFIYLGPSRSEQQQHTWMLFRSGFSL